MTKDTAAVAEKTVETKEQAAPAVEISDDKVTIRPDTESYTKARAAGGGMSQHNGDVIAVGLAGMNVQEVAKVAAVLIPDATDDELVQKYSHLNVGQQRMNLGNRVRGAVVKIDKANAATLAKLKEGEDAPTLVSGEAKFEAAVKPMRRDIDARVAAAAKAETEKKAATAKKKEEAAAKKKAADEKAKAAKTAKAEKADPKATGTPAATGKGEPAKEALRG